MKDSFFEMLMNIFERKLSQLKEAQVLKSSDAEGIEFDSLESRTQVVKDAQPLAMRIFNEDEQMKLTKASYQFIMRLMQLKIIAPAAMELIINRLLFSVSDQVTLVETKWTIRNVLAESLDAAELAFLDLVLFQKEDQISLH